jgi:hypothetical protein
MPPVLEPEHIVLFVIVFIVLWLVGAALLVVGCRMYNRFAGVSPERSRSPQADRVDTLPRFGDIPQATPVQNVPEAQSREPATVPMALPVDEDDFASVGQEFPAVRRARNTRPPGVPVPSFAYALLIVFVINLANGIVLYTIDTVIQLATPEKPPATVVQPRPNFGPKPKSAPTMTVNLDLLAGLCWFLFWLSTIQFILRAIVQMALLPTTFGRSIGVTLCTALAALILGLALALLAVPILAICLPR